MKEYALGVFFAVLVGFGSLYYISEDFQEKVSMSFGASKNVIMSYFDNISLPSEVESFFEPKHEGLPSVRYSSKQNCSSEGDKSECNAKGNTKRAQLKRQAQK